MASYHHGNLRDAILVAAASVIARDGVGALSFRAIATDLGVSHTAFRRHFGDREGVLNALAVQGHRLLAEELRAAQAGEFLDVGVAYVRFALAHPGHFTVMFRPDLLDNDDPELAAARAAAIAPLNAGVAALDSPDPTAARIAGWGLAHGIATLALTGNLAGALKTSASEATRTGAAQSEAVQGAAARNEAAQGAAAQSEAGQSEAGQSEAARNEAARNEAARNEASASGAGAGVEALARRALALLYTRENNPHP